MDRRLAQRPLDGRARYGKSAAGAVLISILHPTARQARRGRKLLLERHVYSHRCHRVRQAPAERHGFVLTAPPRKDCGMQNAIHAAPLELGQASGVGVTINMALLTELGTSSSLKIRIRCRQGRTHSKTWRNCGRA